jgi:hypothetical protein
MAFSCSIVSGASAPTAPRASMARARLGQLGERLALVFGVGLHRIDQQRHQVQASLIDVLDLGPAGVYLLTRAHEPVVEQREQGAEHGDHAGGHDAEGDGKRTVHGRTPFLGKSGEVDQSGLRPCGGRWIGGGDRGGDITDEFAQRPLHPGAQQEEGSEKDQQQPQPPTLAGGHRRPAKDRLAFTLGVQRVAQELRLLCAQLALGEHALDAGVFRRFDHA